MKIKKQLVIYVWAAYFLIAGILYANVISSSSRGGLLPGFGEGILFLYFLILGGIVSIFFSLFVLLKLISDRYNIKKTWALLPIICIIVIIGVVVLSFGYSVRIDNLVEKHAPINQEMCKISKWTKRIGSLGMYRSTGYDCALELARQKCDSSLCVLTSNEKECRENFENYRDLFDRMGQDYCLISR